LGNTFGPFGFDVAGVYSTEYQTVRREVVKQFIATDAAPVEVVDFHTDTSTFKTTLGGILTSAYQPSPEHRFTFRALLDRTTRDGPDGRIFSYAGAPGTPPLFQPFSNGNSGLRYFSNLEERMTDSALDFTLPFKTALPFTDVWSGLPAKFKFGPAYAYRHRNFELRKFEYEPSGQAYADFATAPPELLLDPANIGRGLRFDEINNPADS